MARAMGVHRVVYQAGTVQPYQSVLILDDDGSTFGQTLYVGPTGGEVLANPLTANDLGLIVAYVDTPQRVLARVTLDSMDYDVPFDFVDDPIDVLSSPFAVAGVTPGTAHQGLVTNGAGTLAVWGSSLQSLMSAAGSLVVASSANTPAELAVGTARQALLVNSAGTGLVYGASLPSVLTATGDLPYASAANVPARLGIGANGQVLTISGGLPSWANATVSVAPAAYNVVTNGTFAVNQLVFNTVDNGFVSDQWRILMESADAAVPTQETSDIPAPGARTAIKLTVGATNNAKFGVFQIIEGKDIWHLRGQAVSIQVKMKATAGITNARIAVVQWTGAEDNGGTAFPDPINVWGAATTNPTYTGSWANANAPATIAVTTSWATYTVENISISASATNLAVFIWCDDKTTTTTTDILRIADVQLEAGATATAFQRRSFSEELRRCQRYIAKTFPYAVGPATAAGVSGSLAYRVSVAGTAGAQAVDWRFPVVMRATPAIVTYNPTSGNANWRNNTVAADSGVPSTPSLSDTSVVIANPQVSGDTVTSLIHLHVLALATL
jgi:hypothetical protein